MLMQAFDTVINLAFTAMLVIYGAVAGLGYYYFGDAASTLITEDLAANSPFTGRSVSTSFVSQVSCCSDFCHCIQLMCCVACKGLLGALVATLQLHHQCSCGMCQCSVTCCAENLRQLWLSIWTCLLHAHPGSRADQAVCMQILIPGLTVDKLVAACILMNAWSTYPCLILVVSVCVRSKSFFL